jgi:hypothetical protein
MDHFSKWVFSPFSLKIISDSCLALHSGSGGAKYKQNLGEAEEHQNSFPFRP